MLEEMEQAIKKVRAEGFWVEVLVKTPDGVVIFKDFENW